MEKFSRSIGTKFSNSPQRPQPSPLKRECLMKELGLDDFPLSDDSSDEDSPDGKNLFGTGNELEFRLLQKELKSCTQQRDVLHDKNQSLQKMLQQMKSKCIKVENEKKTKIKILRRAHDEALKDKQNLLIDLQDIFEEKSEHRVLKLVSNIEKLHQEKSSLHDELIRTQDDYEFKLNKIEETFQSDAYCKNLQNGQVTELRNLVIAKEELEENIQSLEREQISENEKHERKMRTLQSELSQLKLSNKELKNTILEKEGMENNFKNSERSYLLDKENFEKTIKLLQNEISQTNLQNKKKSKMDEDISEKNMYLRNELAKVKSELKEKNKEYLEKIGILNNENLKVEKNNAELERNMKNSINDLKMKLKTKESVFEKECNKLKAENKNSISELSSIKQETSNNIENQKSKNKDLQTKIGNLEVKIEKEKMISAEKLQTIQSELQRTTHLLQHQKELSVSTQSDLSIKMQKNEEEFLNKIAQIELLLAKEKGEAQIAIKRLEEKKANLNNELENQTHMNSELRLQLSNGNTELKNLKFELNNLKSSLQNGVEEQASITSLLTQEQKYSKDLNNKLQLLENEKEDLEQKILSMATDNSEKQNQQTNKITKLKLFHEKEIANLKLNAENVNKVYINEIADLKLNAENVNKIHINKTSYLLTCLRTLSKAMKQLSQDRKSLEQEVKKFPKIVKQSIDDSKNKIMNAVSELNDGAKNLMTRYQKEMKLRKKYHNQVLQLKGNIRVFVRARPQIKEDGLKCVNVVKYDELDDSVIYVQNKQKKSQSFEFDCVFQDTSTQQQVYSEVQSLVTSCMDGYQVCIFAYGQTGSGKTYTMEGSEENPGINQRALADLFQVANERSVDWDYTVTVSLVEIYNESLKDLLSSSGNKLDIKMNSDGSLFVQNLQSIQVKDLDAVNKVFRTGQNSRQTASTSMNEHSSRSHAVLTVTVNGKNKTTGSETLGKLNLIDLAGSERVSKSGASGDRLKEAQNINRSLSALGDVMHSLKNKNSHVPFRNSKLTYLLQDSLSNDGKALMVVQVSPVEKNMGETICSLTFAQRVRLVELGPAVKKTK